ncbi:MAG: GGDEF-domain containing protein, partial [Burkholderiales bacterium]
MTVAAAAYESLIQFLYRAPIGLVQTTLEGDIEMINPMSANLLMPLSCDGSLNNLFTALQAVAPQLRQMAAAADQSSGIVCESLRIPLHGAGGGAAAPQILSFSLLKLNESQLMAVIIDATLEVQQEQEMLTRQLGAAARLDKLTRMPNRVVVLESLRVAMART